MEQVSNETPYWSREKPRQLWDPSRQLLKTIRRYKKHNGKKQPLSWVICKLIVIQHRFWSVITGADIPLNCNIDGGLLIPHPNGVVIHPDVKLGPNCLIFQQVTIGAIDDGIPTIGGHVDIGAGAKIIGNVRIGNNVKVGANAVVTSDIPDNCTAVGIPARIIHRGV